VRLDTYIRELIEKNNNISISRTYLERLLKQGGVILNGRVVKKKSYKVKESDFTNITFNDEVLRKLLEEYRGKVKKLAETEIWNDMVQLHNIAQVSVSELFSNKSLDRAVISEEFKKNIQYENDEFLIAYKKSGVLSHPGSEKGTALSLLEQFIIYLSCETSIPRAGLLHRLDKDTNGLLIFAKSMEAFNRIKKQFDSKSIIKFYLAVFRPLENVSGKMRNIISVLKENSDLVEPKFKALLKNETVNNKELFDYTFSLKSIELNGYIAIKRGTNYMCFDESKGRLSGNNYGKIRDASSIIYPLWLDKSTNKGYLAVQILTGRTHQIRAQLKYMGAPIIGDRIYGGESSANLLLTAFGVSFYDSKGERVYINLPQDKILL